MRRRNHFLSLFLVSDVTQIKTMKVKPGEVSVFGSEAPDFNTKLHFILLIFQASTTRERVFSHLSDILHFLKKEKKEEALLLKLEKYESFHFGGWHIGTQHTTFISSLFSSG